MQKIVESKPTVTTIPTTPATPDDAKSKAGDAIGRLKTLMTNLKMPSPPIKTEQVKQEPKQEGGASNDKYYEKYLKYKKKYMDLKRQMN